MAKKVKLQFVDGTEAEVPVLPFVQIAAERHFKGLSDEQGLEQTYWMCWFFLKPGIPFDDWIATVEDIAQPKAEADETPLAVGPSAGG